MSELIAYLNGEYVPVSQCKISVMDIGVTSGASVTDMTRTFHQELFRLEDHVDRFFAAAKHNYLKIPHTKEEVCQISRKIIELNKKVYPECEFGMCYYVTPGVSYVYAGSAVPAGPLQPTYCQHVFPLPFTAWKDYYVNGAKLVTSPIPHIPPQCISPRGKHRNRLHMSVGGGIVASMDPTAMPIYLDQFGNITETGGSNFVIYKDGVVYSPKRRNILGGISLQTTKELVEAMGSPFVEEDIMIYDAVNADEAWITTTPYCLAPVSKFNGQTIGDGTNPLFHKVLKAWGEMVGKDLWDEIVNSQPINYR